jgi:hypothetical protein
MEENGQIHALAALPPGKAPLVHSGQEAGWTQTGLDDMDK